MIFDDLITELSPEGIDPGSGFEANLDLCLFTRVDCNGVARDDLNELFLEVFNLAIHVEGDFNFFLRVIDEADCS